MEKPRTVIKPPSAKCELHATTYSTLFLFVCFHKTQRSSFVCLGFEGARVTYKNNLRMGLFCLTVEVTVVCHGKGGLMGNLSEGEEDSHVAPSVGKQREMNADFFF